MYRGFRNLEGICYFNSAVTALLADPYIRENVLALHSPGDTYGSLFSRLSDLYYAPPAHISNIYRGIFLDYWKKHPQGSSAITLRQDYRHERKAARERQIALMTAFVLAAARIHKDAYSNKDVTCPKDNLHALSLLTVQANSREHFNSIGGQEEVPIRQLLQQLFFFCMCPKEDGNERTRWVRGGHTVVENYDLSIAFGSVISMPIILSRDEQENLSGVPLMLWGSKNRGRPKVMIASTSMPSTTEYYRMASCTLNKTFVYPAYFDWKFDFTDDRGDDLNFGTTAVVLASYSEGFGGHSFTVTRDLTSELWFEINNDEVITVPEGIVKAILSLMGAGYVLLNPGHSMFPVSADDWELDGILFDEHPYIWWGVTTVIHSGSAMDKTAAKREKEERSNAMDRHVFSVEELRRIRETRSAVKEDHANRASSTQKRFKASFMRDTEEVDQNTSFFRSWIVDDRWIDEKRVFVIWNRDRKEGEKSQPGSAFNHVFDAKLAGNINGLWFLNKPSSEIGIDLTDWKDNEPTKAQIKASDDLASVQSNGRTFIPINTGMGSGIIPSDDEDEEDYAFSNSASQSVFPPRPLPEIGSDESDTVIVDNSGREAESSSSSEDYSDGLDSVIFHSSVSNSSQPSADKGDRDTAIIDNVKPAPINMAMDDNESDDGFASDKAVYASDSASSIEISEEEADASASATANLAASNPRVQSVLMLESSTKKRKQFWDMFEEIDDDDGDDGDDDEDMNDPSAHSNKTRHTRRGKQRTKGKIEKTKNKMDLDGLLAQLREKGMFDIDAAYSKRRFGKPKNDKTKRVSARAKRIKNRARVRTKKQTKKKTSVIVDSLEGQIEQQTCAVQ